MCINCDTVYIFSQRQRIQLNKDLGVDAVVEKAINQLYDDRTIDKPTRKQLLQSHYQPLKQAVNEGFGKIEYNSPNYEFLKQLQTNVAVFAAFKNHAYIKEMVGLLKDQEGNLRSRESFKAEALKIDSTYRTTYLDAEYDTAVRTARLAAQWQKIQKNKKLYPNLRYLLTKSSQPDEKHLKYVGIVAPVDSVFWQTHYPPNRWRCQCGVEQTDDEVTDIPSNLPPVDKGFDFNAGTTGQIFDLTNSSYIKSVPPKEQPALIKEAKGLVNIEAAATAPYQQVYKSKSGTTVEAHPLSFADKEFQQNLNYARDLANSKVPVELIQILPILENKLVPLRPIILPDAKGNHNPDFRIDGKTIEAKEPIGKETGKRTIQNNISNANNQADGVMLFVDKDAINEVQLFEDIYKKMHHAAYASFQLYLKYGDEWSKYNQAEFLKEYRKRKKPQ